MRALITGAGGFVGGHLISELLRHGHVIAGFDLRPPSTATTIDMHVGDITDPSAVRACVSAIRPDVVFHLAGAASVGASFADPVGTFAVNHGGTLNICEAVRESSWGPRLVCVTSAEIYGVVPATELPVDEDTRIDPTSPYGASKAAADITARQYHRSYGVDAITVRPFNHIGPGQDQRFVVPSIARQIALGERSTDPTIVIRVGNVSVRRDFLDVRDVVRAYRLIAERGQSGAAYVVGKGRSESVEEIIALMGELAEKPVEIRSEDALMRAGEAHDLYWSPARLTADVGWKPRYTLVETLTQTLDWWRAAAAKE